MLLRFPSFFVFCSSNSELSITIPELDSVCCDAPAPELKMVNVSELLTLEVNGGVPPDDAERNSIYETASVASDLTRMCVSDEEDKLTSFLNRSDVSYAEKIL